MTHDELRAEIRAIDDLHQQINDHFQRLARRLYRHFDVNPGGGEPDRRLTMTGWSTTGRRDDEDDGSD